MSATSEVKFIFVCPIHNRVFESTDFRIIENRGVVAGPDGGKVLEAKVALDRPCPLCGEIHVYRAADLACPFGSTE